MFKKRIRTITIIFVMIVLTIIISFNLLKSEPEVITSPNVVKMDEMRSPSEVYLDYKKAIDSVQDFDEYVDVMLNYSSSKYTKQIAKGHKISPEIKEYSYNLIKNSSPNSLQIIDIGEEISEKFAVLYVNTTIENLKGDVRLVNEDNGWKIELDDWDEV